MQASYARCNLVLLDETGELGSEGTYTDGLTIDILG